MSMEQELSDYILADAQVFALINTRYFPLLMPQNPDFPSVVYTVINENHNNHLAGGIGGGLVNALYQLDVYSPVYATSRSVKEALRNLLDGVNHVSFGAVFVESILLESTPADMIESTDSSQVNLYRVSMTFRIAYQESVPTG